MQFRPKREAKEQQTHQSEKHNKKTKTKTKKKKKKNNTKVHMHSTTSGRASILLSLHSSVMDFLRKRSLRKAYDTPNALSTN
eukprot:470416-Amphidinium_carterae.1